MCFFTRNYKYSNRNEEIEGAYLNYSYFQSQKHVCLFLCSKDHYSVSKTIYDSGRDLKIDQGKNCKMNTKYRNKNIMRFVLLNYEI